MGSSSTTRSSRRVLVAFTCAWAAVLAGCTSGDEAVRSPLTVEDLGPGDWVGPAEDAEDLDQYPRTHDCGPIPVAFMYADSRRIDRLEVHFGTGQTRVLVRGDRFPLGDSRLAEHLDGARLIEKCEVDPGSGALGPVSSATFHREPDGAYVLESLVTWSSRDFEITTAVGADDEWLVMVEVSHLVGEDGPDAVELLDRALANLEAFPAPEVDE